MSSPLSRRCDKSKPGHVSRLRSRPQLETLEERTVLSNVVTDLTSHQTFSTISAAILAVTTNNGDVISVGPGTYIEDVVVTKSLKFVGPNQGVNPNSANRAGEAIIEPATTDISGTGTTGGPNGTGTNGTAVSIQANNVTFDGFTIEGSTGQSGTTVTNNGVTINSAYGFSNIISASSDNYAVSGLVLQNNIIKDFNLGGAVFDTFVTGATSAFTGNVISNNKIDNVDGNDTDQQLIGTGIITADNFYAAIDNNVITRVQTGIQIQLYSLADTSGNSDEVKGNAIGTSGTDGFAATGIYYSDFTQSASPWTFSGNSLVALTGPGANTAQTGFQIFRIAGTNSGVFKSNNVTGGVTGVEFFSDTTNVPMVWQGGVITGANVGLLVTNSDSTFGNSNNATQISTISTTISNASVAGIEALDNGAAPTAATVNVTQATITNCASGVLISGVGANHAIASVTQSDIEGSTTAGINDQGGQLAGVSNSLVKNNQIGILVGATSTIANPIFDNDLSGSISFAVKSAIAIDASGNWWGTNNPTTILAKTSGTVDFTPFLDTGTNSASVGSGYQGPTTVWDVTSLGAQLGSVGRIQEGISFLPSAGGTINVLAGTYIENDVINKPVNLKGVSQASTTIEPLTNAPNPGSPPTGGVLPSGASTVILIQASGVTISNLTVEGAVGGTIYARNGIVENDSPTPFSNTNINNVTVKDVYYRGINLGGTNFSITACTLNNITGDPLSAAIANIGGSGAIGSLTAGAGNTITSATAGILDSNAIKSIILGNTISSVNVGIHVDSVGSGANGGYDVIQANNISSQTGTTGKGIYALAPVGNVSVQYNTVTGFDTGLALYSGSSKGTATFLGNSINGLSHTGSVGITLTTDELGAGSAPVKATVQGNFFANTLTGIQVGTATSSTATETINAIGNLFSTVPTSVSLLAGVSGVNLKFNDNSFEAGSSFVDHGTGTVNAENNFWGNATGPTVPSNSGGTGTTIVDSTSGGGSGTVDYANLLLTQTGTGSFTVTVTPKTGALNSSFTVTITALLATSSGAGGTDTNYSGTVSISSGGLLSGLPATYTFAPATDMGTKTFTATGVDYGTQPIVVTDTHSDGKLTTTSAKVSVTGNATTTTTLAVGATFTYSQSPVTLTATVTPPANSANAPSGSVLFFVDGHYLTTSTVNPASAGSIIGVATASYKPSTYSTSTGTHTITAYYAGDGIFLTSKSAASSLAVQASPPNVLGYYAVGSGPGVASSVQIYKSDGTVASSFSPFGGFTGGVRVAVGNVYGGTGEVDIIAAAGPGGLPQVVIYSISSSKVVQTFNAYDPAFRGGVYVASTDLNPLSSSHWEIITGQGGAANSAAVVNTYYIPDSGTTPVTVNSFAPYTGASAANGANVAAGDLYGTGTPELITSQVFPATGYLAPVNTSIQVYTYSASAKAYTLKTTFDPFNGFPGGYNVAVVATAVGERLVVGAGPGGKPTVAVIDPNATSGVMPPQFMPFSSTYTGGVVVGNLPVGDASGNFTSGGILTGQGLSADSTVNVYDGVTFGFLRQFTGLPSSSDINGIFVAGA